MISKVGIVRGRIEPILRTKLPIQQRLVLNDILRLDDEAILSTSEVELLRELEIVDGDDEDEEDEDDIPPHELAEMIN